MMVFMGDRRRASVDALLAAISAHGTALAPDVRQLLLEGKAMTGLLGALAIRVQENASRITDDQVESLTKGGVSDDLVFEAVVAAAIGAGMERLRRVLQLMGQKP
jgi:hypothetical protein